MKSISDEIFDCHPKNLILFVTDVGFKWASDHALIIMVIGQCIASLYIA